VNPFGVAWKHRTFVARIVTDRDDAVEIMAREFINRFRPVAGNVDSDLSHNSYGFRSNGAWRCACARHLITGPAFATEQTFSHLAASRVPRAQNKYSLHSTLAWSCWIARPQLASGV
jgi:heme-degrading monooxygenase HmoA